VLGDEQYSLEAWRANKEQERKSKREDRIVWLSIFVGTLICIASGWCIHDAWPKPKPTFTVTDGSVVHEWPVQYRPNPDTTSTVAITSGPLYEALTKALAAWKKEIGPLPIKRPTLEFGDCHTAAALACAHPSRNAITVVALGGADDETVLMHEVGHLLNVPHIEDDDLMEPGYTKKLDKPTPLAVALAKFQMKNHVKTGMEGE
jgi:hypothetical protein